MACSLSNVCGGCTYADMNYEEQLKLKEDKVFELLKVYMKSDDVWEGIYESPLKHGYRNKMEYSFGDEIKDGPLTLGLHKKKSFYSVINCDECDIVCNDYNRIVKATREFFESRKVSYVHKRTHEGYLRHLLVRKSFANDGVLIDIITKNDPSYDCMLSEWKDMLLSLKLDGHIEGILHTVNDSMADAVKDEGTQVLYGKAYLEEVLFGLKFKLTAFSFFQTNSKGAEVLYGKIRDYVGDTKGMTVYDLYSGTGTIAQIVAPVADKVYGVEIVEEAVAAARENAVLNGLDNCEFIAGDVLKVIDGLERKPDMIILDPPRDGLHPKVLPKIVDYGVDRIVYVACKPESFVRDYPAFAAGGYRIEKACAVDMFPYTKHVECVVEIQRVNH